MFNTVTLSALWIYETGHKSCFIKPKQYKFHFISEAKEIIRVFFAIVIDQQYLFLCG